jgi:hypothetical protein
MISIYFVDWLDIDNTSNTFHLRIKKQQKKWHLEVAATYRERYVAICQ